MSTSAIPVSLIEVREQYQKAVANEWNELRKCLLREEFIRDARGFGVEVKAHPALLRCDNTVFDPRFLFVAMYTDRGSVRHSSPYGANKMACDPMTAAGCLAAREFHVHLNEAAEITRERLITITVEDTYTGVTYYADMPANRWSDGEAI